MKYGLSQTRGKEEEEKGRDSRKKERERRKGTQVLGVAGVPSNTNYRD